METEENLSESQRKPIVYKALLWEKVTLLEDRLLYKARVMFLSAKHEIFYKDIRHIDVVRVTVVPSGGGKSILRIKGVHSALSPCQINFALYQTEDQQAMLENLACFAPHAAFNEAALAIKAGLK